MMRKPDLLEATGLSLTSGVDPVTPEKRASDAIARHVWLIATYIRGATVDPARRLEIAANLASATAFAIDEQERLGILPEIPFDG